MIKEKILEYTKHLPQKEQQIVLNNAIDLAIQTYQKNKNSNNFDVIAELYEPLQHMNYWRKKYGHLFDQEEFYSEYMLCFLKACEGYKKKTNNKNQIFNSYFFSVLNNHFINEMIRKSCGKRNISVTCPLCDEQVAPLNIHILKEHDDLIEELLVEYKSKSKCPFCSEKLTGNKLVKHITSKHSSMVFEYFQSKFPDYSMAIQDPAPPVGLIHIKDENSSIILENAKSLYDNEDELDNIKDNSLSECQKAIKGIFEFYSNISKLPSYKRICSLCKEMRESDDCPRGNDFVLTKVMYEEEIKKLSQRLLEEG